MNTTADRLTVIREANARLDPERHGVTATAEPRTDRPPLWSRVMREARGRALSLARRAFPWRYY
jgi:hypothetical protein